jgi:predicted ATPase
MPDPLPPSILCPILIGRDPQVAVLARLLDQARAGHGQIALISGEAGIGKSRLVAETRKLAYEQGFAILQGTCFEPDRVLPYAPLIDLLRTLPLATTLPTELSVLLSGQHTTTDADPEQTKRRLFAQFMGVLREPVRSPQLLILEDLHWADDTSLEFLQGFARTIPTQPLCLWLTYRSDETHPALTHFLAELERGRLASELTINRLRLEETTTAVRAIFAQRQVRSEFVTALQTLTDGNPFFVEETLKALVASGEIFQERGVWTRKPLHALHIPRTVQDAVQRRTAQLSAGAYTLLTTAAVAGQRFDFDLLQAVTGQAEPVLLAQIKELIAAQLVAEDATDHFVFRHALTRQAIYNGLLGRERRALHLALLNALESRATPDETLTMPLADHAHASQQWAKSLRYSRQAGEQAQRLFAPRAAAELFGRALEANRHLTSATGSAAADERLLLRRRAHCYETLGEFDLARADYEQALTAAQGIADQRSVWENLFSLGFLWTARNMAQAGAYLDQALTLARRMGDPALLAASLNRIGNWRLNMEQPIAALQPESCVSLNAILSTAIDDPWPTA